MATLAASIALPKVSAAESEVPNISKSELSSKLTGISLSSYCLRDEMKWEGNRLGTDNPSGRGKGTLTTIEFLDYCASLNVTAAELTAYYFPQDVSKDYLLEVKRHAFRLGIELPTGAIGNNFAFEPSSKEAKEQLDFCAKWVDNYALLGVTSLRIFSGEPAKDVPVEQALDWVAANLSTALEYAASKGIILALENHDYIVDVERLQNIVSRFDSPWLGVTFDSGNLAKTASPYEDLAKIAPLAVNAQIKTTIPVNDVREKVDYARILKLLADAKYRGRIVLEFDEDNPREGVPRELAALQAAIDAI